MSDLVDLVALNERAKKMSAQQVIAWGLERFGARLVIASSFSLEDVAVIDIASRVSRRFRVVTLDTGRLHEETYEVMEAVRNRYGVVVEVFFPERAAVEELVRIKGLHSFRNSVPDRKECCRIRKVEPLSRALKNAGAWATGMRASQSVTRTELQAFELDERGLVKLNPLWKWSDAELAKYVEVNNLPKNKLHALGYPSIGCAPCTRAIAAGEDQRAGRWWWEAPEHKECGLHPSHPALKAQTTTTTTAPNGGEVQRGA